MKNALEPSRPGAIADGGTARQPASASINDERPAQPRPAGAARGLGAQSIFETVTASGLRIGAGKITPHDLRRTFAKLAHQGRAPLEQIQLSLGHASIQTTERYLGLRQNLHDAPCDRLGLVGWEG